jgi:hypothetical protein
MMHSSGGSKADLTSPKSCHHCRGTGSLDFTLEDVKQINHPPMYSEQKIPIKVRRHLHTCISYLCATIDNQASHRILKVAVNLEMMYQLATRWVVTFMTDDERKILEHGVTSSWDTLQIRAPHVDPLVHQARRIMLTLGVTDLVECHITSAQTTCFNVVTQMLNLAIKIAERFCPVVATDSTTSGYAHIPVDIAAFKEQIHDIVI